MNRMNITASVNLGNDDSVIECEIDHGRLNFHQQLLGMVRLRNHLNDLINSMPFDYKQPTGAPETYDGFTDRRAAHEEWGIGAIGRAQKALQCRRVDDPQLGDGIDEDIKITIPEDFYSREYDPEIQRHGRRITDTPV
jgi:hypothetical protein